VPNLCNGSTQTSANEIYTLFAIIAAPYQDAVQYAHLETGNMDYVEGLLTLMATIAEMRKRIIELEARLNHLSQEAANAR